MPDGLIPVLLIILAVIVWVLSKVLHYNRKSEAQWQKVDKTKLKAWEDDEDW